MSNLKNYEYENCAHELLMRVNNGENQDKVANEVSIMWAVGNEYLWNEYNIESILENSNKNNNEINKILYQRIINYRDKIKKE